MRSTETRLSLSITLVALFSCVGEVTIIDPDGPARSEAALWQCLTEGNDVTCDAALPAQPGESGAYACEAADPRAVCPPPAAVSRTPGLDALLTRAGADGRFDTLRWACLLTGAHQRTCVREVAPSAPEKIPTEGGEVTQPPPPAACDPELWEAYFAQLATFEYRAHGVKITFPRELFDTTASFDDLAIEATRVPANEGAPSCAEGEWAMRQQAWLDAVMNNCLGLNQEILVMCQQAANYAPAQGACGRTGTW